MRGAGDERALPKTTYELSIIPQDIKADCVLSE